MEKPIIIAPLICLPPMKEVHAIGKKQEESVSRKEAAGQSGAKGKAKAKQCPGNAKPKQSQRKSDKGKNSTCK